MIVEPFLNVDLVDMPDEKWESIISYDGIYEISNFGRVKSLSRYDSAGRWIKERILKQTLSVVQQPTVKLSESNNKKTFNIPILVANAFLRDRNVGEVIRHINGIKTDNRVTNLEIVSHSESKQSDYNLKRRKNWGIDHFPRAKRKNYEQDYVVKDNDKIICKNCKIEKETSDFYSKTTKAGNKYNAHICIVCRLTKEGVKEVGKHKDRADLANRGYRFCAVCKELKNLNTDFGKSKNAYMGKSFNCKCCVKILNAKYNAKRKNQLNSA